jgi:hypothetical protein
VADRSEKIIQAVTKILAKDVLGEGFLSPPDLEPEQNWRFELTRNIKQYSAAGTGFGNLQGEINGRGLSSWE